MQIFINKPLIPNRFLPSQSLNHFVWLCSGRNDAVYQAFKANAAWSLSGVEVRRICLLTS